MQFKKNFFSLTAQELSHAQWAISTGNYDTELGKSIQRKLLGHLVGTPDDFMMLLPIVAADLMDNRSINFSISIDEGDDPEVNGQLALSADKRVLTCEFIIQAEELDELEHLDANDPATKVIADDWVACRKTAEIMEKHGDEMWRMCQYEGVDSFDDADTEIIEREDGSIHVTYSVAPVHKIH